VQLNIEPVSSDGHRKINIVDVLNLEPDAADDDSDDEDARTGPAGGGVASFVESFDFCQLRKRFNYPECMADWTRVHTAHWAKWVNRTFKGVRLNEEDW
jgi:hypothetical protein